MSDLQRLAENLRVRSDSKIMMCVLDGLGGLPVRGKTELESARTPNLDEIARLSACGFHIPVARGITPGSGAAHLGLFGYDPLSFKTGRGVIEAAGLNIKIGKNDLAARGNFATVKIKNGKTEITDRRAGRISTQQSARLVSLVSRSIKKIGSVKIKIYPGAEHRFVVVMTFPHPVPRGETICDTDPQKEGAVPVCARTECADRKTQSAALTIRKFVEKTSEILQSRKSANFILLRGFSALPKFKPFEKIYGLRAACVAAYPMYRGIAGLVGMELCCPEGGEISQAVRRTEEIFPDFNFIYMHIKSTDRHGEDGNFRAKAKAISDFDEALPRLLKLKPDVLIVTGDHSTPALMSSHSWHPVPLLIKSRYAVGSAGFDEKFNEKSCRTGELATVRSVEIMPLALAHAGRLAKFGA